MYLFIICNHVIAWRSHFSGWSLLLHPVCLTFLHVVICHHFLFLQIPLGGPLSVVGRALVVHELEDDLGKGNFDAVLKTTVFTFVWFMTIKCYDLLILAAATTQWENLGIKAECKFGVKELQLLDLDSSSSWVMWMSFRWAWTQLNNWKCRRPACLR